MKDFSKPVRRLLLVTQRSVLIRNRQPGATPIPFRACLTALFLLLPRHDPIQGQMCPRTPAQPATKEYSMPATIADARAALRAIEREYPKSLKENGVEGSARVFFQVNPKGRVEKAQIARTSGNVDLDSAAVRAALKFKFTPAYRGREAVCTWMQFPIKFSARSAKPVKGGDEDAG